jgi:dienelactone hydrolase
MTCSGREIVRVFQAVIPRRHSIQILPLLLLVAAPLAAADPWGLVANRAAPLDIQVLADETDGGVRVREIYYTGEVFQGKPVRVYGFLACPIATERKLPGVLQLHGGGGTASKDGAERFARSAPACALSIDWSADPARGTRVTDVSPLGDRKLFSPTFVADDLSDFGGRHLARALSRGLDVLEAQPEVDPGKLAVFGGSWGGFLSLFIAGLDERARCVSSGYGAGAFAGTWSYTSRHIFTQGERQADLWLKTVDPVLRANRIRGPVALLTATNEVHFWLNTAAATSAKLPPGSRLVTSPNTVHVTTVGWPSLDWLQYCFGGAPAWPEIRDFRFDGKTASWKVTSPEAVERSELYFAPGRENWPGRCWLRVDAQAKAGEYRAVLPPELAGVDGDAYPLVVDASKRSAALPHRHTPGLSLREFSARRPDPGLVDDFARGIGLWRPQLGSAPSVRLERLALRDGVAALQVTEAQGKKSGVVIETNAVSLATARLGAGAVLTFALDTAGAAASITVQLCERAGHRDERILSAQAACPATAGLQKIRIPLDRFQAAGGPPAWGDVSKLTFRLPLPAGGVWKLAAVRIEK